MAVEKVEVSVEVVVEEESIVGVGVGERSEATICEDEGVESS